MKEWYQDKINEYYNQYQFLLEEGKPLEALLAFGEMSNYQKMLQQNIKTS